jgi:hypothetical protein
MCMGTFSEDHGTSSAVDSSICAVELFVHPRQCLVGPAGLDLPPPPQLVGHKVSFEDSVVARTYENVNRNLVYFL